MDGTPTLRLNEFILGALAAGKIDLGPATPSPSLAAPKEITLKLSSQCTADIHAAEAAFDKLVGAHDLEVLHFDQYGKEFIKKFKTSPDAWAQLVKQLAFWKFKGRPGVTYESTQTRKFQLGRTEVTRSASNESKAWVSAMMDPSASVRLRRLYCHKRCSN
jgi:carnitine O-acetyltransferase